MSSDFMMFCFVMLFIAALIFVYTVYESRARRLESLLFKRNALAHLNEWRRSRSDRTYSYIDNVLLLREPNSESQLKATVNGINNFQVEFFVKDTCVFTVNVFDMDVDEKDEDSRTDHTLCSGMVFACTGIFNEMRDDALRRIASGTIAPVGEKPTGV